LLHIYKILLRQQAMCWSEGKGLSEPVVIKEFHPKEGA
jgi:hypothetical protein